MLLCIHNSQKFLIKGGVIFVDWVELPAMEEY